MESINNIASAASKAIWGEGNPTDGDMTEKNQTLANESLSNEPKSGVVGDVKAGEPYDKGNTEPTTAGTANKLTSPTENTGKFLKYGNDQEKTSTGPLSANAPPSDAQGPAVTTADKPYSADTGAVSSAMGASTEYNPSSSKGASTLDNTPSSTKGLSASDDTPSSFGKTQGIKETEKAAKDDGAFKTGAPHDRKLSEQSVEKAGGVHNETGKAAKDDGALETGAPYDHKSSEKSAEKAGGVHGETAAHKTEAGADKPQEGKASEAKSSGGGGAPKGEDAAPGSEAAEKHAFAVGQLHQLQNKGTNIEDAIRDAEGANTHPGSSSKPTGASSTGAVHNTTSSDVKPTGASTTGAVHNTTSLDVKPASGAVDHTTSQPDTAVYEKVRSTAGVGGVSKDGTNTAADTPVRNTSDRFQHDSAVTDPTVKPTTSTDSTPSKDEGGKLSLKDKIKAKLHKNKD